MPITASRHPAGERVSSSKDDIYKHGSLESTRKLKVQNSGYILAALCLRAVLIGFSLVYLREPETSDEPLGGATSESRSSFNRG
jgi:hypothetical protein